MEGLSVSDLISFTPFLSATGDLEARFDHITHDSRQCRPGSLFVALAGEHADGHDFIPEAIEYGCRIIIGERESPVVPASVTYLRVHQPRQVMSKISAWLYGSASHDMKIIGVTGTDGKTTTCYAAYQLLINLGHRPALLTTVYYDDGNGLSNRADRITTPEAPVIHQFLATAEKNGCDIVVLEASSHALSPRSSRLADVTFDAAVLTTLTSDHLEFHMSRNQYIEDKLNLFRQLRSETCPAILPSDLVMSVPRGKLVNFPVNEQFGHLPNFLCRDISAALSTLISLFPEHEVPLREHTDSLLLPEGRWEQCTVNGRTCIIDYAHTPDAFDKVLSSTSTDFPGRRCITLFGAAGSRDTDNRPKMGVSASRYSDVIIITSDDPRNESPRSIFEQITCFLTAEQMSSVSFIPDREQAITQAVQTSRPGDILLFLGKGHEKSQILHDGPVFWDEKKMVIKAFRRLSR
jgi:UDP-N-acetylmuramoyl-L-alanyl-D-glutamate--2,6-diaminopimelate ligase